MKDPDILTLEKENNCLKEALDQANLSVKQISEIFESTKDENQEQGPNCANYINNFEAN